MNSPDEIPIIYDDFQPEKRWAQFTLQAVVIPNAAQMLKLIPFLTVTAPMVEFIYQILIWPS